MMKYLKRYALFAVLLIQVFLLTISSNHLLAQCVNANTPINFNIAGNNTSPDYATTYVLTDDQGKILKSDVTSGFLAPGVNGSYYLYAVNYRISDAAPVLTIGTSITSVNGSCVSVSAAPAQFCVTQGCYLAGSNVSFSISGNNTDPDYTTLYVLTENDGSIISTHTGSPIKTPSISGTYKIYAVNYNSSEQFAAPDFAVGTNISAVGGCSSISSTPITFCATSSLPVTLVSFSVQKSEHKARLSWSTTSERDSDRFEVEQSKNGKKWTKIGTVVSHGESEQLRSYFFDDINPSPGENLYRLKMVDLDGSFSYSRIQSVRFDRVENALIIYPNPTQGRLNVKDYTNIKEITLFDAKGHMVYRSESIADSDGSIKLENVSPGLYAARILRKDGTLYTQKLIMSK